jgi:hypothetical protein
MVQPAERMHPVMSKNLMKRHVIPEEYRSSPSEGLKSRCCLSGAAPAFKKIR